jgi:hypothetical protein
MKIVVLGKPLFYLGMSLVKKQIFFSAVQAKPGQEPA